ncbi:lysine-specific demethylase 4C-like isoform X4 [Daphnia pulicaria]|nr:lysine-specific demethylase 4C-like isoform X4 [Daphnia pulicaria]XP_046636446.1 lysine-specific demethylase 4C-like isoform X4 [Daphnia pulicaria]XP_046636455.1 lysine-specific demethylase 4C-like isoform X4 [Daphnia pulicaria]XP_046636465.1 lysine-specific demethylase 4C-like isoform X4 [Daphnia pulicaria]XP_046636475.1 lysine-specific demethylase 4C-like isoform X4 [Daphnia pulicaria]XP_046636484.1 lysine-specific demethylase 4C-like isoform X4 [Daphnia pulicaria]XP_046636496.1 lysine-s
MEESSSASQDVFSKTRIQKPSPNSHIKSCLVPGTQFGVSSSSSVTSCAPPCPGTDANPASNTTDDLHRKQFTCITSTNNQSPPPSSSGGGDERRSRKQKSPRKGLDSRDVSTNLTIMWEKQKDWTWTNECEFNVLNSQQEPYCCVCSVLRPWTPQKPLQSPDQPPKWSAVVLPDALFGSDRHEITSSILLRCSSCCICVHAKCCGLAESTVTDKWICRRCERTPTDLQLIKCCLCQKRGGLLKGTTDGRWAHVVCTICFPGVSFVNPDNREPIFISPLGWKDYVFLNCSYCSINQSDYGANSVTWHHGSCLPCVKQCGRAFHPLCGLVNGVRFTISQNGDYFSANCCNTSHTPRSTTSAFRKKAPVHVSVGQQVYAKHPESGEYHLADVTDNTQTVTYYSVDFNDGTNSQDTYPEDIKNYNCKEDGPPIAGAAVEVLWTDGKSYGGHYRGFTKRKLYSLSFRDGTNTVITAERPDFYHPDEDLPKDLRIQLDKQKAAAAQMQRLQHACPAIQP